MCTRCKDTTMFAKPDGTCAASCDAGFFGMNGVCKKCGMAIATCEYDAAIDERKVLTCESGFFKNQKLTACVTPDKCGVGYFANSGTKMCEACSGDCSECMMTATKCTKCKDNTKTASADGTCLSDFSRVDCGTMRYKDTTLGRCAPCDKSCDMSVGCIGKTDKDCKACGEMYKVRAKNTLTSPTTYTCVEECKKFSEVKEVDGMETCMFCPLHETMKVYDQSTMMCIAEAAGCPAGTVLTTADMLMKEDTSIGEGVTAALSSIKLCAKCDGRCATCHAMNPMMCET
jgi:hypothetical protein